MKRDLVKFSNTINPNKYNGAMVLGINGIVIKSHGSATPEAFAQALKNCLEFIKKESRNITVVSLTLLGLGSYMFYLWRVFGDPLYFFHLQSEFGAGRQEGIILLPQVIWRYIKIFMTVPHDWKFFSFIQEFIFSLVTLGSLLIFWKKIRPSHLLFSLF